MIEIPKNKKSFKIIRRTYIHHLNEDLTSIRKSDLKEIKQIFKEEFIDDKQELQEMENILLNLKFSEDEKNNSDDIFISNQSRADTDADSKNEILSILGRNTRRVVSCNTLTYSSKLPQEDQKVYLLQKHKTISHLNYPHQGKLLHEVPERISNPIYRNIERNKFNLNKIGEDIPDNNNHRANIKINNFNNFNPKLSILNNL